MAAILDIPVTLPASKMIGTMTSLIGDVRFSETLKPSRIVNELVNSCRVGNVDYGKGIVYTFKTATQAKKTLSETSSAFTISKPSIAQEVLTIGTYEFIPLSYSETLARDSMLSGYLVDSFLSFVSELMEDSYTFNMFDVCNGLYQNWTPPQKTQTITVPVTAEGDATGADLKAIREMNATAIAETMRTTINNMLIKSTKFTDVSSNESALARDNTKIVFNDKYYTQFLSRAMASLYHSEKLGEMIPGENFVLLPSDSMKSGNEKVIAWVSAKEKFAFADFYRLTLSIKDPSTLYTNYFYHYAYGAGVFKNAPGVKFVAAA